MNPSSSGWIKKLLKDIGGNNRFFEFTENTFYNALRSSGFLYGSSLDIVGQVLPKTDLTEEELSKVNLCLALLYMHNRSGNKLAFIDSINNFYADIHSNKIYILKDLLGKKKSNNFLESIIHKRIQIDANILTKNFKYFIINALLFIDVLAYKKYLEKNEITLNYLENLEACITCIVLDVLKSKEIKYPYDLSLIKLFDASLRYQESFNLNYKKAITHINSPLEKYYILDLACMATWSDHIIDFKEQLFLKKLGKDLSLNIMLTQKAVTEVNHFYSVNKSHMALLSSKNSVQSFYNNTSKMVNKLITRNSKRLYQELLDSKELVILLSQSTRRDLNKEEQKKVQEQLLDIFKSIPSLAIFLLPGGALLLPLVIKFIPKLLPSAFDENRIDD